MKAQDRLVWRLALGEVGKRLSRSRHGPLSVMPTNFKYCRDCYSGSNTGVRFDWEAYLGRGLVRCFDCNAGGVGAYTEWQSRAKFRNVCDQY